MNIARRLFSSSSRAASSLQAAAPVAGSSSLVPASLSAPVGRKSLSSKVNYIEMEEVPKPVLNAIKRDIERAKVEAKERAERRGEKYDGKVMVQNPFLSFWRPATDP